MSAGSAPRARRTRFSPISKGRTWLPTVGLTVLRMFSDLATIAKERLITLPEDVPPPRDDTPPYDPKYVFV